MIFKTDEILQLTGTIWGAMLGLPIGPDPVSTIPTGTRSTVACVQITGAWNGAILLDCPAAVARRAASIMFSAKVDDVLVTDLQDAVAELVNMIGGNIKALLPESCYLSLPSVVEGGDYSARVPGSHLALQVEFESEGHRVTIRILEKCPAQTAAA